MLTLEEIACALSTEPWTVVMHNNADLDAFGSAVALYTSFGLRISAFFGLSRAAKHLQRACGVPLSEEKPTGNILILDTAQMTEIPLQPQKLMVIDHHPTTKPERNTYVDAESTSCAEIVYKLIKISGRSLDRRGALGILAGILSDTSQFRRAGSETLRTVAEIMEHSGVNIDEVLSLFDPTPPKAERIARLKAAQRLGFEDICGFIVATSVVGAYESSSCLALLQLGADIALVASQRNNKFQMSTRATPDVEALGLNMGQILQNIGREIGWDGGGHPSAAGMRGVGDAEAALHICKEQIKEILGNKAQHKCKKCGG